MVPDSLPLQIVNHLNGRPFRLIRAHDLRPDTSNLAVIVSICNQPEVYDWLFRGPLDGRPYTEINAHWWLNWASEGWATGSHFGFAVIDQDQHIAAACDIKTADAVAEIGYWASQHHRGIMTNAVIALRDWAERTGYNGLFARTKRTNYKSQNVLQRAGFVPAPSEEPDYLRFEISFAP